MAVSWTQSSGDKAATWTQSSGEIAANWDTKTLMRQGTLFWEGVEDNYEDISSGLYEGIDESTGNWEDLG